MMRPNGYPLCPRCYPTECPVTGCPYADDATEDGLRIVPSCPRCHRPHCPGAFCPFIDPTAANWHPGDGCTADSNTPRVGVEPPPASKDNNVATETTIPVVVNIVQLTESDVRRLIRDELGSLIDAVVEGVQAWALSEGMNGSALAASNALRSARVMSDRYAAWAVDDEGNRV